jgi:acyl-CoA synthetase (AMP-forming)/AMP-acid ligase II
MNEENGLNIDHVAMDFTNKPEFLFVMMGLLCIGAVPALINYNLTSSPLIHCIKSADVKLLIFDPEISSNVQSVHSELSQSGIRILALLDHNDVPLESTISWCDCVSVESVESHSAERPPDSLRSGVTLIDMEALMFTSGTTGRPKAAIVSFDKLGFAPMMFHRWAQLKTTDRFYTCMPLYHGTALILGASMMIKAQGTLVLGHKFSSKTFWKEVRESRATVIQYVGEMCRYLLSQPPSEQDKNHCVRAAFGNGMRPDVWNRFRERFGINTIAELYAATGILLVYGVNRQRAMVVN